MGVQTRLGNVDIIHIFRETVNVFNISDVRLFMGSFNYLMAMYSIELDVLFKTTKLALSGLS